VHKMQGREREACAQNTGGRYLLMRVSKGADSIWFFFPFFNQRPAEDEESAEEAGYVCCVSLSIVSSFAFILCHIIIHTMSHHHTYYVSLSIVYCCVSLSILSHTIHRENAHNTQEENTGQRDRIRLCCLIQGKETEYVYAVSYRAKRQNTPMLSHTGQRDRIRLCCLIQGKETEYVYAVSYRAKRQNTPMLSHTGQRDRIRLCCLIQGKETEYVYAVSYRAKRQNTPMLSHTGQRDRIRLCCLIVCSVALPCIFLMCVMCNALMYGMCIFLPSTRRVLKRQGTSVFFGFFFLCIITHLALLLICAVFSCRVRGECGRGRARLFSYYE